MPKLFEKQGQKKITCLVIIPWRMKRLFVMKFLVYDL